MKGRRGFTLVEMMVVLAIVAILAALAAPGYETLLRRSKVRKTSDLIAQVVLFSQHEALSRNRDIFLSVVAGPSPALCVSTDAMHACDVRRYPIAERVAVALADGGGSALADVRFSRIFGSPSPVASRFAVSAQGTVQTVTVDLLGGTRVGGLT